MKIIGGKLKGRTMDAPRGVLSRPPLAVIRESVFNVLLGSVEGRSVLDLFAGSGSLGMEAVSRGASRVHFVESAGRCARMIERNAGRLGIQEISTVTRGDAVRFIREWRGEPFDIVFIDPPFLSGKTQETLAALDGSPVARDGTLIVARVHWREKLTLPQAISTVKTRKFGDSLVLFLKKIRQAGQ